MPAPISIVIPTLNAEAELARTLATLVEGLGEGLVRELVVSDGGSADATVRAAENAGARVVAGAPGRGGQLARGVAAARGDWLLVLHADTWLRPGWASVVRAHLEAQGGPAAFRLAFRAEGTAPRLVAGWANLRSRAVRLPYGDQGLLVSRDDYAAAGGYPEIPLMEDVALVRALARAGQPVRLLPAVAETGAARYEAEGWARRGGRNLVLLGRYMAGAAPETLARDYGGTGRR